MNAPLMIRHRVNTVKDLAAIRPQWGVEIDIRSRRGKLILNHEPHASGDLLETFLRDVKRRGIRGPIILNTKEDGHERAILALLEKIKIKNFFFLDSTLPTLVRLTMREKIRQVAVRVSEYEPFEFALSFKGRAEWIWLDCFSGKPPSLALVKKIRRYFRICAVSPELQGYSRERIATFRSLMPYLSAVCTKYPELWNLTKDR